MWALHPLRVRPMRTRTLPLLALLALSAPGPAPADVLVLRDGQVVRTEGPWRVEGRQVLFTNLRSQLATVRLSEVDVVASKAATLRLYQLAIEEQIARQPGPTVVEASAAERARRETTGSDSLLLTKRGSIIALDELALALGVPIDQATDTQREVLIRYLRQLAVFVDRYQGGTPERLVQMAKNPVELQTLGDDLDRAIVSAPNPALESLLGALRKAVRDLELQVAVDPLGAVAQLASHVRVKR